MKRLNATFVIAGAFVTLLLGATALSAPAHATPVNLWEEYDDDDGTLVTMYYDDECDCKYALMWTADGVLTVYHFVDDNPDNDSTGKGSHADKPDVVKMIKVGDVTYTVRIAPADSAELMSHLKGGAGLGPRYNPSDDDNGHGPGDAPSHGMEVKKTEAEIRAQIAAANAIARQLAFIGSAMGDGEEGGGEGPNGFNKSGAPGGTGNDDGNYTEGQNKTVGKTEKDLLGAKPEVVNPPHTSGGGRTATGGAGGGAGGGSLGGGAAHTSMGGHG